MKLRPEERVSMDVAKERALGALNRDRLSTAASVTNAIWPGHGMRAPGAGAAASRILKALESEGRVRWSTAGHGCTMARGWYLV